MSHLKSYLYLFSISFLIVATGCAQTMRVNLISPDLNIGRVTNLAGNVKVAFEPFEINSKDQKDNLIGKAKVGFFNSEADIISTEPVSSIIVNSVKKGFSAAGFTIVDLKDTDFIITGIVEKFWVDEYATGFSFEYSKASVRYDIIIKNRQNAPVWANTLDIFKTSGKSMETTGNDVPTLLLALKESVEAIFRDQTFWSAFSK